MILIGNVLVIENYTKTALKYYYWLFFKTCKIWINTSHINRKYFLLKKIKFLFYYDTFLLISNYFIYLISIFYYLIYHN